MSLDVYLITTDSNTTEQGSGIFVRENGSIREITREEWNEKFPGQEPIVYRPENDSSDSSECYHANITHNLTDMAKEAGIYEALWRPYRLKTKETFASYDEERAFEEGCAVYAREIIPLLEKGLNELINRPDYYEQFNASNGWGTYIQFVDFVRNYLTACIKYPNAIIDVSR